MAFNKKFFDDLATIEVKTPFPEKDLSGFTNLEEYADVFSHAMGLFDLYQEKNGNVAAAFAVVSTYQDKEDAKAFLLILTALEKISTGDYRTVEQMLMN